MTSEIVPIYLLTYPFIYLFIWVLYPVLYFNMFLERYGSEALPWDFIINLKEATRLDSIWYGTGKEEIEKPLCNAAYGLTIPYVLILLNTMYTNTN